MQDQARDTLRATGEATRDVVGQAIDQIPPDAWPIIDLMMQVLMVFAAIWLVLTLIAWWRRRAYNLTIASSASINRKARPAFTSVDHAAREAAIKRGEGHEQDLDEREAAEEKEKGGGPLPKAGRFARLATLAMSIITLLTGFTGAIFNVTNMHNYLQEAGTAGRIEYVVTEYPFGCAVAVFVIGYNIWRYAADKKWEKA